MHCFFIVHVFQDSILVSIWNHWFRIKSVPVILTTGQSIVPLSRNDTFDTGPIGLDTIRDDLNNIKEMYMDRYGQLHIYEMPHDNTKYI